MGSVCSNLMKTKNILHTSKVTLVKYCEFSATKYTEISCLALTIHFVTLFTENYLIFDRVCPSQNRHLFFFIKNISFVFPYLKVRIPLRKFLKIPKSANSSDPNYKVIINDNTTSINIYIDFKLFVNVNQYLQGKTNNSGGV